MIELRIALAQFLAAQVRLLEHPDWRQDQWPPPRWGVYVGVADAVLRMVREREAEARRP
jgi:hypothetical protein